MASEVLVVTSKVKRIVKDKDLRCSSDVMGPLSDHIEKIMSNAAELAESENMKTVQAKHVKSAIENLNGNKEE
jgi:histone H3/H4